MTAASQARRRAFGATSSRSSRSSGATTRRTARAGSRTSSAARSTTSTQLIARSPEEHRAQRHRRADCARGRRHRPRRAHGHGASIAATAPSTSKPFDQLVIATGATPIRPDLPGIDARGVHGIQTIGDGIDLRDDVARSTTTARGRGRRRLRRARAGRGAAPKRGMHGDDRRSRHRNRWRRSTPTWARWSPTRSAASASSCRPTRRSTGSRPTTTATSARSSPRTATLPADIVVLGIGVQPNVELAADAGIAIGERGGIVTDRRHGDERRGRVGRGRLRRDVPSHLVASRSRSRSARTRTSKGGSRGSTRPAATRRFAGVIGTAVTKICDNEIARTGLSEREAEAAGLRLRDRDDRGHDARVVLPGRGEDHDQGRRSSRSRDGCSARRSSARKARPSASTCWRPRSGTR